MTCEKPAAASSFSAADNAQRWSAEDYAAHGRFVADMVADLVAEAGITPGLRVLDLGCGDGALTQQLAERGAIVTGVDTSPELVAAARARGIDAQLADGHALAFDREFDLVFSNAALHWMLQPEKVLAGVYAALKPGGRFVAEMGAARNIAAIRTALAAAFEAEGLAHRLKPVWYFPETEEYAALLQKHGFTIDRIYAFARPTPLKTGMRAWLHTFAQSYLQGLTDAEAARICAHAERLLAPVLQNAQGVFVADYMRLRIAARKAA